MICTEINFEAKLKPHQLQGLQNFIDWFKSDKQFATLIGKGGSGKSFAVGIYTEAAGIKPEHILACAPTNDAARNLGDNMELTAMSIHKAYGLLPYTPEWTQDHQDDMLRIAAALADDATPFEEKVRLEKQELMLKLISKAASTNELMFMPSPIAGMTLEALRLIVIDECSMVSEKLLKWIEAYTPPHVKVLFLGDNKQLPPVDDNGEVSKTFNFEKVAEFDTSVRSESGSSLSLTIDKIRDISDPKAQLAVLRILDDIDSPSDLTDGQACLIAGKRKKMLIEHFARTLKPDGYDWRILAYRNATVDAWNRACKFSTGTQQFGIGDTMIARTGLQRYGDIPTATLDYDGNVITRHCFGTVKILENGSRLSLGKVVGSAKVRTSLIEDEWIAYQRFSYDSKEYAPEIALMETERSMPFSAMCFSAFESSAKILDPSYLKGYLNYTAFHENPTPKGAMRQQFAHQIRLLPPQYADRYKTTCEYWAKLSQSFGKATKHPEASDTVREFMENVLSPILGLRLDKPKAIHDWFHEKVQGTSNLVRLKKYVAKVSQSFNYLVDDVVYPFASTIHRSQGQTIENVLIDLSDVETINFGAKDQLACAIYTGVSRAANRLIVLA
jgi:hypothetical protein